MEEITFQQYERCQKYLDGKMQVKEQEDFLNEVNNSPALKEHLLFEEELEAQLLMNEMDNSFSSFGYKQEDFQIVGTAPHFDADEKSNKNNSKSQPKVISIRRYAAAASVALLLIMASVIYFKKNTSELAKKDIPKQEIGKFDFEALANTFYEKDNPPENKPTLIAQALTDYGSGDYSRLQKIDFDNLPQTRGPKQNFLLTKETGYYYQGLSFLETAELKKANEKLDWVIKKASTDTLVTKAMWYRAVIFVKNGAIDSAKSSLQTVIKRQTPLRYSEKAKQFLAALPK